MNDKSNYNDCLLTEQHVKEAWALIRGISIEKIAKETGLSKSTVTSCVMGRRFNRRVAERVLYYLEKDIEQLEKFEQLKQKHLALSRRD